MHHQPDGATAEHQVDPLLRHAGAQGPGLLAERLGEVVCLSCRKKRDLSRLCWQHMLQLDRRMCKEPTRTRRIRFQFNGAMRNTVGHGEYISRQRQIMKSS